MMTPSQMIATRGRVAAANGMPCLPPLDLETKAEQRIWVLAYKKEQAQPCVAEEITNLLAAERTNALAELCQYHRSNAR